MFEVANDVVLAPFVFFKRITEAPTIPTEPLRASSYFTRSCCQRVVGNSVISLLTGRVKAFVGGRP